MIYVVCGSREWKDRECIRERLERLPEGATVVSGMARGADRLGAELAEELGFTVIEEPADWSVKDDTPPWAIRYHAGKPYDMRAGGFRNDRMLDYAPTAVLAFTDELDEKGKPTGGTGDCVTKARRRGIAHEVISHEGVTFDPGRLELF